MILSERICDGSIPSTSTMKYSIKQLIESYSMECWLAFGLRHHLNNTTFKRDETGILVSLDIKFI